MQAAKIRSTARAWERPPWVAATSAPALAIGLLLAMGCGTAAPIDVGTDISLEVSSNPNPEALPADEEPGELQPLIDRGMTQSAACASGFQACGGVLAGRWIMEDTCNNETRNPKALQIWGQTFMNLDAAACWDAVESVTSRWTGMLLFEKGKAIDHRMRSDTIEMNLTRTCLNATFDSKIQEATMARICAALTNDMTNCSSVGGVCRCSNRRESEIDTSGTYAVLGKSVAIGTEDGGELDFFDYCVDVNRLLWREPTSRRHMVLRREGAPSDSVDPEFPR